MPLNAVIPRISKKS